MIADIDFRHRRGWFAPLLRLRDSGCVVIKARVARGAAAGAHELVKSSSRVRIVIRPQCTRLKVTSGDNLVGGAGIHFSGSQVTIVGIRKTARGQADGVEEVISNRPRYRRRGL